MAVRVSAEVSVPEGEVEGVVDVEALGVIEGEMGGDAVPPIKGERVALKVVVGLEEKVPPPPTTVGVEQGEAVKVGESVSRGEEDLVPGG